MGYRIMMNLKNKITLKLAAYILIGGAAGFAYYYFIGCTGNSCPITGNPYMSTGYGMAAGLLLGWESKNKKETQDA
jgi:hypothetical protein